MFLRTGRSSRSVDYLLSALSQQDVANSAAAYVDARDRDSMLLEIKRSVVRMRGSERAQYALALGYELPTRDDFPISEPAVDAQTILQCIDADPLHAIERFGPLLGHNPRILRTLDPQSIREIFLPVINARQAEVQGTDIGDDVPYTTELAAALQRSIPAINLRRVARSAAAVPLYAPRRRRDCSVPLRPADRARRRLRSPVRQRQLGRAAAQEEQGADAQAAGRRPGRAGQPDAQGRRRERPGKQGPRFKEARGRAPRQARLRRAEGFAGRPARQ